MSYMFLDSQPLIHVLISNYISEEFYKSYFIFFDDVNVLNKFPLFTNNSFNAVHIANAVEPAKIEQR